MAVEVLRDGITVRLADSAGNILDHLYCQPRKRAYTLTSLAEPAPEITLRIGHITPHSDARVLAAVCLGLPQFALAPERLVPQYHLSDRAAWPADPYAEPGIEDAGGRLRDRVFRSIDRPVATTWLHNLRVLLEPRDEQSHCLMKWGLYEPESLLVMQGRLKPGDVMVDVGANCGLYALVAARSVGPRGRVIALEPSPREFARLQENVVLNGFTQVHCAPVAVSDVTGQVRLHIAQPPFGGHNTMAERFVQEGVVLAEARTVPSVTLDELLRDADRCDLIKLDIEGAELHALRGAAASLDRFRPALLLEVNPAMLAANGTSAADLLDWLRQRGYVVHGIDATTGALAKPVIAGERTVNVLCLASDQ